MAGQFADSFGKQTVREMWNTPLLRYLNQTFGFRYRYMGLPGINLIDVQLWKDMIDEVVAFEIRAPQSRKDPAGRQYINDIRRNLRDIGIPGYAYFGPMEEVLVLGADYDGTRYEQGQLVTLYNLDFCDEISSRIATREYGRRIWRFEAIREIFRNQAECYRRSYRPNSFMLMITIRNQLRTEKLRHFLGDGLYHETQSYVDSCVNILPIPNEEFVLGTHTWAIKAFLYDILRQYLANPHISALFFPVVKYTGRPVRVGNQRLPSPMLHFMVFCRFESREHHRPVIVPARFLTNTCSVRAQDDLSLIWEAEPGEPNTTNGSPQAVQLFQEFEETFVRNLVEV